MAYYPLSQIKTNLYTSGNEYTISNSRTPYVGYYWKNSQGKIFTGKTPQDLPIQELFPITSIPDIEPSIATISKTKKAFNFNDPDPEVSYEYALNAPVFLEYDQLQSNFQESYFPYYLPQTPTSQDYQVGEFRRFFCKKTNQIQYIEINKNQYDLLVAQSPQIEYTLFIPFFIDWSLKGNKENVAKVNKNSTELVSFKNKFYMLSEYLRFDWTKYYQ